MSAAIPASCHSRRRSPPSRNGSADATPTRSKPASRARSSRTRRASAESGADRPSPMPPIVPGVAARASVDGPGGVGPLTGRLPAPASTMRGLRRIGPRVRREHQGVRRQTETCRSCERTGWYSPHRATVPEAGGRGVCLEHGAPVRARGLRGEPPPLPGLRRPVREERARRFVRPSHPRRAFRDPEHLVALGRRMVHTVGGERLRGGSPRLYRFLPAVPTPREVLRLPLRRPQLPGRPLGLGSPHLPLLPPPRPLLHLPPGSRLRGRAGGQGHRGLSGLLSHFLL